MVKPFRPAVLVAGADSTDAEIVRDLRELSCVATGVDACESALEMMETIDFGLILVNVERPSDWRTCRRIAAAASCPVVVVTHFLAADRRYRDRAFQMGVSAYIHKPCTQKRLREMLKRLRAGERPFELVDGPMVGSA